MTDDPRNTRARYVYEVVVSDCGDVDVHERLIDIMDGLRLLRSVEAGYKVDVAPDKKTFRIEFVAPDKWADAKMADGAIQKLFGKACKVHTAVIDTERLGAPADGNENL